MYVIHDSPNLRNSFHPMAPVLAMVAFLYGTSTISDDHHENLSLVQYIVVSHNDVPIPNRRLGGSFGEPVHILGFQRLRIRISFRL